MTGTPTPLSEAELERLEADYLLAARSEMPVQARDLIEGGLMKALPRLIETARQSSAPDGTPWGPWPAVSWASLQPDDQVQIVLRGKISKHFAGDGFNIVDPYGHNVTFTAADLRNAIVAIPPSSQDKEPG